MYTVFVQDTRYKTACSDKALKTFDTYSEALEWAGLQIAELPGPWLYVSPYPFPYAADGGEPW